MIPEIQVMINTMIWQAISLLLKFSGFLSLILVGYLILTSKNEKKDKESVFVAPLAKDTTNQPISDKKPIEDVPVLVEQLKTSSLEIPKSDPVLSQGIDHTSENANSPRSDNEHSEPKVRERRATSVAAMHLRERKAGIDGRTVKIDWAAISEQRNGKNQDPDHLVQSRIKMLQS